MRDVKFRAWDKDNNCMMYQDSGSDEFVFSCDSDGMHVLGYSDAWSNPMNCEIMQYIGRHDINGKEVYEGDTVKAKGLLTGREFTGIVEFRDCSFCIVNDCVTNYRWMDYEVEVIGNIYENPELLKED